MHIPDGLVPAQVCVLGYGITGLVNWYMLRQIERYPDPRDGIPKAALLAAAFFVASSLRLPVPPASLHPVLNGLLGALLGYYTFPAILVGLLFQAVIFGHGGLSTLGLNALIMGVPALIAHWVFQLHHVIAGRTRQQFALAVSGFLAGAVGVGLAVLLFGGMVLATLPGDINQVTERQALYGLLLAHLPLVMLEGLFTMLLVLFLQRVKPELLKS